MLSLLSHPATTAFGLTILHALWQGALIAGLVALLHLRSSSARTRYAVAMIGLFSLPLISAATFFYYYEPVGPGTATALDPAQWLALLGSASEPIALDTAGGSDWRSLLPYLTVVYFLGLLGFALRLAWGGVRLYLLRHRGLLPVEPSWQQRLAELNRQHDIWPAAQMHVSTRVRQVLSFGHFKPLILFPIGVLNRLTSEEVETILLHELAHLKRRDYLWNWLQCVIETTYFFHPAIYWLGVRIRREREYCCDDWVASRTDRTVYAQSLIHLARFSITSTNQLAMYANDRPALLSTRIERLFQPETRRRSVLPLLLLLIPFLLFAWKPTEPESVLNEATASATDSIPAALDRPMEGVVSLTTNRLRSALGREDGVTLVLGDGPSTTTEDSDKTVTIISNGYNHGFQWASASGNGEGYSSQGHSTADFSAVANNLPAGADPLYFIDGQPSSYVQVTRLAPGDIEAVTVRKGESFISRFGPEAKDGVVFVTTRQLRDPAASPAEQLVLLDGRPIDLIRSEVTPLQAADSARISTLTPGEAATIYGPKGRNGAVVIETFPRSQPDTTINPQPLFIIDGERFYSNTGRPPVELQPESIESINVLKGAAAIAKFGAEGSNGVIIIQTKAGAKLRDKPAGGTAPDKLRIGPSNRNKPAPLYVIDGKVQPRTDRAIIDGLDPEDIEWVSEVKGPGAIAKFGEEGRNGVIFIKTKTGTTVPNDFMDALEEAPDQIRFTPAEEKSPLYFVDGERQADDFDLDTDIDVTDIKAIRVLKDKSATDAYGPDGKHGVMLITTKSGPGKSKKKTKKPVVAPAPVVRPEPAPVPAVQSAPVPTPAPAPRYLASTIYPNPSTGETQVLFRLEAEEQVTLTIFDAAGRQVRSQSFGRLPKGEQQLDFNVRDLPTGNYTVIVQAGTARWKGTVIRP